MPPRWRGPARQGDGDIYVVITLPTGTFANAILPHDAPLHKADFTIEAFPSSLLYVPRDPHA